MAFQAPTMPERRSCSGALAAVWAIMALIWSGVGWFMPSGWAVRDALEDGALCRACDESASTPPRAPTIAVVARASRIIWVPRVQRALEFG